MILPCQRASKTYCTDFFFFFAWNNSHKGSNTRVFFLFLLGGGGWERVEVTFHKCVLEILYYNSGTE